MHKSTRVIQHEPKSKQIPCEDPQISKKSELHMKQNPKISNIKAKIAEKKEVELPKYDSNFSQESQNVDFLEKRVEVIIEEALNIENEFGKTEKDEDINFEERMQGITAKLQQMFEGFGAKQEELEAWLRDSLSNHIQGILEKVNIYNQTFENIIKERNELQSQTTQALGLAISVQKYLKENQKLWTLN